MHRRTTTLIVAAAAVAFAAGSASAPATAGAARMGKSKIEKIAAAVVDQKASSLKVAHATTADRATTADKATTATTATSADKATSATTAGDSAKLGGQAPSAYQTYSLSVNGAQLRDGATEMTTRKTWTLTGLQDGGYLAFYDLALQKSAPTVSVDCWLGFSKPVAIGASVGMGATTGEFVSGNAPVSQFTDNLGGTTTTHEIQLGCEATGGTFAIANPKQTTHQSTLTLLRTDAGPAGQTQVTVTQQ